MLSGGEDADVFAFRPGTGNDLVNKCSDEGKLKLPGTCLDGPGVDRAGLHQQVADEALAFFIKGARSAKENGVGSS